MQTTLEYRATAHDAAYIQPVLNLNAPLLTGEKTTRPWVVKMGELAEVVR